MDLRPLLPLLLLASAAALAQDADERVLRAGDTALRVEVVEVPDRARAELLQRWIAETTAAPLSVFGRFPLRDAQVRIKQIDSDDRSPVPWGQTLRSDGVAVLLFVRRDASLQQLRDDWTAVHELSHLFHPYLGDRGRWLAEGLASYYQNVLRARIGVLDGDEAWRRLEGGFQRGRKALSGVPLDELGRRRGGTMRVYWAGAAFWLEADLALRKQPGRSLDTVLAAYSACCLGDGTALVEPEAFMAELDRIAGGDIFASRYRRYAAAKEFPLLDAAYRELGIGAADGRLVFSRGDAGSRLREAVMTGRGRGADVSAAR
ncbi:hypothetical protein M2650_10305 [Luteimonas sp. SX5]|uniref:Peptidase M61 catalytic domain-containing protein n=1 Tax=Luteimonas galliterrae TaxID=2940486 RepID=A0ABT0ML94_9GAMM|nr:hypothetical protein [Luteimonas galliterrae]MCL1635020.1 hypothetical protein [Luteimonas galliterrae]